MPPRTRRSQAKVNVHMSENADVQSAADPVRMGKKRTLTTTQDRFDPSTANPSTASTRNASTSKKARIVGPPRGRPLQLDLGEENNNQGELQTKTIENTRRTNPLMRTSSFYPGRGPDDSDAIPPFSYPLNGEQLSNSEAGDTEIESEEDWLTEPQLGGLPSRNASKVSDMMVAERPIWHDSTPASVSVRAQSSRLPLADDGGLVDDTASPEPLKSVWPAETDLTFVPGTKKVMLMAQQPIIRSVIQDSFERIRAALAFKNAFPDTFVALDFVQDSLLEAAESHDRASDIYRRLLRDADYMNRMMRLPRARIALFRADVKERCVAIVQAEFLTITSSAIIVQLADRQLDKYNYTTPPAGHSKPERYVPMRTQPYRNARITTVIRDLFFSGGMSSLAHRFRDQFPTHTNNVGEELREVPIAMVALVATALYAAIEEWKSGEHKAIEFSANAYLDVYNGNVETIKRMRLDHEDKFHLTMSDIYSQASTKVVASSRIPIGVFDLDDIEG